ncbi:hypothetical protein HNR42_001150 [Deinobacterium chartae]|uniref:YlxR domain-containing protein n=1 Tax=Deinobacterium chartae TaxID=521158 RepID=A0A841HXX9_9DEIO|nr:YlxR family protein [Deinobacterium chartae]MBB6097733.1 hypothetical protein [Deinobacterium chartae]
MMIRPEPRTPHVPERTCVACRRKRPQAELLRLRREGTGWVLEQGRRSGRGAYLCADSPECWTEKRLRRFLRGSAPSVSEALQTRARELDRRALPTPTEG